MKILKKFFYTIIILIMLCFAGVLFLAFSPAATEALSEKLYGKDGLNLLAHLKKPASASTEDGTGIVNPADIFGDTSGIAAGVLATEESAGYVAPLRGSLNLPSQVIGKNGREPVSGSGEELAEEQAAELGTQLRAGETGDNLAFDAAMYPYYQMLNQQMQHLYRQIYANAGALNKVFAPVERVNTAQLKNVFEAVYNDHPELFWLETMYSCKYGPDGNCVSVELSYNRTAQDLGKYKTEFEAAAEKILAEARKKESLADKERYVHDALLKKADYSLTAPMNQSAYSALVNGDTVCAGYSRAFQYLMQQLGIPCYYCTGYSGEDHAWNIIQLEDGCYNVDATWDDMDPVSYDFFNKTDADFVGTHVRTGLSVYLPPCGLGFGGAAETLPVQVASEKPGGITLNPNPQQPLTWQPTPKPSQNEHYNVIVSGNDIYDMDEAGVKAEEVLDTMDKYYADCLKQMVKVGSGQKSFSNVVPKHVLAQVEASYGAGEYEKKYVTEGLKKLKMDNFAILIQVEDLGGNYYRLYHNIATW